MSSVVGGRLLIGAGNRLRGDDGVGPEVVARVGRQLPVATRELSGEATELLAELAEARASGLRVILVDACFSGAPAGTIHRVDGAAPVPPGPVSSHGIGVGEAIALGRALGLLPERLSIVAVEGESFAAGAGLSPPVERAAARLARELAAQLANGSAELV